MLGTLILKCCLLSNGILSKHLLQVGRRLFVGNVLPQELQLEPFLRPGRALLRLRPIIYFPIFDPLDIFCRVFFSVLVLMSGCFIFPL